MSETWVNIIMSLPLHDLYINLKWIIAQTNLNFKQNVIYMYHHIVPVKDAVNLL